MSPCLSFFKIQILNNFFLQSAWLFNSAKYILFFLLISEFCWSSWLCAVPWYLGLVTFPYQCDFWKTFHLLQFTNHIGTSSAFQSPVRKLPLLELEIDLFLISTSKDWVYFPTEAQQAKNVDDDTEKLVLKCISFFWKSIA